MEAPQHKNTDYVTLIEATFAAKNNQDRVEAETKLKELAKTQPDFLNNLVELLALPAATGTISNNPDKLKKAAGVLAAMHIK